MRECAGSTMGSVIYHRAGTQGAKQGRHKQRERQKERGGGWEKRESYGCLETDGSIPHLLIPAGQ